MGSGGQAVQTPASSLGGQKDTPPGHPGHRARAVAVPGVSVPDSLPLSCPTRLLQG